MGGEEGDREKKGQEVGRKIGCVMEAIESVSGNKNGFGALQPSSEHARRRLLSSPQMLWRSDLLKVSRKTSDLAS